jgi:hypothetical protein
MLSFDAVIALRGLHFLSTSTIVTKKVEIYESRLVLVYRCKNKVS